jgi:hypothetical protein
VFLYPRKIPSTGTSIIYRHSLLNFALHLHYIFPLLVFSKLLDGGLVWRGGGHGGCEADIDSLIQASTKTSYSKSPPTEEEIEEQKKGEQ